MTEFTELLRFEKQQPPGGGAGWYASTTRHPDYWLQLRLVPDTHPPQVALVAKSREVTNNLTELYRVFGVQQGESSES